MVHLLVDFAVLQLGLLLERLVGRVGFAALYVATGVFVNLERLTVSPVDVHVDAAGSVFGAVGLL